RGAREAAFSKAALLVRGLDELEPSSRDRVMPHLAHSVSPLVLVHSEGEPVWHGPSVTIPRPSVEVRVTEWRAALAGSALEAGVDDALPALAAKFELDTGAIAEGAATALGLATARDPETTRI